MNKRWLIGGVAVAVVAAGTGWTALKGGKNASGAGSVQAATPKPEDKPLDFTASEAARPQSLALAQVIEFSGPLVAPDTAIVRAKAAGTLLSLAVEEGQHVQAGQTLGRLDLSDLSSRVAERRANLEAVKATLAQAERTHQSNTGLAEQKYISPVALDASRSALDNARAQVGAAQASLDTAQVALREAALVSPISGVVAKRQAVAGEKLAAEQALATVIDLRRLELSGLLATADVPRLKPGMAVEVRVEGVATPFKGSLARIAPAAEAGTRSIGVVVSLANPKEALRAGQYASARVSIADGAPRLTVPLGAVSTASGQDYVWTVEKGALIRRTVTTGRRDPASGRVEVLEGIVAESVVLGARFDNLREGAKARIVASAAPAPGASGATVAAH